MNPGILTLWRNKNGSTEDFKNIVEGLNKQQRERIRELQQTWLALALQIISSTESSNSIVMGITSPDRKEGKTVNCMGLASALARETDASVIVVECDVISPSIAEQLNLEPTPGLVEYTGGEISFENLLQRTQIPNLDVIVAGGNGVEGFDIRAWGLPALSELKRSLPSILDTLKQMYTFILLDLPPILTNAYAKQMLANVDDAYLAVMSGATSEDTMSRAAQDIGDERLAGVILTGASSALPDWVSNAVTEVQ